MLEILEKVARFHRQRLAWLLLVNFLLLALIAWIQPPQLGVLVYKLALVSLYGWASYWIGRAVFVKFRPDAILPHPNDQPNVAAERFSGLTPDARVRLAGAVLVARAAIIGFGMLAGAQGL